MPGARHFFSSEQLEHIRHAIAHAELDTSGEIRVHLEENCKGDVMDHAAFLFKTLDMHKTKKRNGVLIYLAIQSRKFAILGDVGINAVVPPDFWDHIKESMLSHFREDRFEEGLVEAIERTGEQLHEHFPYQGDDINELTNEISFTGERNQIQKPGS